MGASYYAAVPASVNVDCTRYAARILLVAIARSACHTVKALRAIYAAQIPMRAGLAFGYVISAFSGW